MASPRERTYLIIGGAFGAALTLLCTAKSEKAGRLLERISGKVVQVLDQVTTPFEILQRRAKDLDRFVGEMICVGREQASKVDTVVSHTANRFEQTSDVIQNNLVESALELSAFLKAVKAGLDQLMSRKPSRAA